MAPVRTKCTGQEPQVRLGHPAAFAARWAHGLYALSSGTGLIAPVFATMRTRIGHDISIGMPGPHDFNVRERPRTAPRRQAAAALHEAGRRRSSDDAVAATASRPACRDDAYAPPAGTERGG